MLKLRTPISEEEFSALIALAMREMREPAEQAHFIIRKELEQIGLLSPAYCISPFQVEDESGITVKVTANG